jgi:hypothetical protein
LPPFFIDASHSHRADSFPFPFGFAQGYGSPGLRLIATAEAASANDMHRRGACPGKGCRGYPSPARIIFAMRSFFSRRSFLFAHSFHRFSLVLLYQSWSFREQYKSMSSNSINSRMAARRSHSLTRRWTSGSGIRRQSGRGGKKRTAGVHALCAAAAPVLPATPESYSSA